MKNLEDISKNVFQPPYINSELFVKFCGFLKTDKKQELSINKPNCYVMLYVYKGTGTLIIDKREHYINASNLIIVAPNTTCSIKSDIILPLNLFWAGFSGSRAKTFLSESGFSFGNYFNAEYAGGDELLECFQNMIMQSDKSLSADCAAIGYLYQIFGCIMRKGNIKKMATLDLSYVATAVKFINENFHKQINVADVASHVNLERTYFTKIFKADMGVSPQEYLIDMRMTKAAELLKQEAIPLKELCSLVGYSNYNNFCKMFRIRYGISPQKFSSK